VLLAARCGVSWVLSPEVGACESGIALCRLGPVFGRFLFAGLVNKELRVEGEG
jgi:hypothetical protein